MLMLGKMSKSLNSWKHMMLLFCVMEQKMTEDLGFLDLQGVHSARAFVEWYNGLPENSQLAPDLDAETAVILGQGNVALDVARILLSPITYLEKTDICEHALETLRKSQVRKVYIVGRRGPLQVAFTIKELREMTKLEGCKAVCDPEDFHSVKDILPSIPRHRKRLTELMLKTAFESDAQNMYEKEWRLKFQRSPVKFLPTLDGARLCGVRLELNCLVEEANGRVSAQGTGVYEDLSCGLVFRSIGYRSLQADSKVPFDKKKGVIPNVEGRVVNPRDSDTSAEDVDVIPGLYCSGWVRNGPIGVIATTMNDAFQTGKLVVQDLRSGRVTTKNGTKGFDLIKGVLHSRGIQPVWFEQWNKIDQVEQERGKELGKLREKIVSIQEMLDIAHNNKRKG